MDIVALDDHVARVDADAEGQPRVIIDHRFLRGHAVLPGHRAGERVHHAGELDQQPVAHELDDAATVLGDEGSRTCWRSSVTRRSVPASSAPMRRV